MKRTHYSLVFICLIGGIACTALDSWICASREIAADELPGIIGGQACDAYLEYIPCNKDLCNNVTSGKDFCEVTTSCDICAAVAEEHDTLTIAQPNIHIQSDEYQEGGCGARRTSNLGCIWANGICSCPLPQPTGLTCAQYVVVYNTDCIPSE